MDTKCEACESGPSGHGGHESLYSFAFLAGNVVMKCRRCGTCWTRQAIEPEGFDWLLASAAEGCLIPSASE